jgi:hypothetical protein
VYILSIDVGEADRDDDTPLPNFETDVGTLRDGTSGNGIVPDSFERDGIINWLSWKYIHPRLTRSKIAVNPNKTSPPVLIARRTDTMKPVEALSLFLDILIT